MKNWKQPKEPTEQDCIQTITLYAAKKWYYRISNDMDFFHQLKIKIS